MTFLNPLFFWLLLIVPLLFLFYFFRNKKQYSSIAVTFALDSFRSLKSNLLIILFLLRIMAIVLIIIALSRPQEQSVSQDSLKRKGIDIMIAMDISSSMLAEDFNPVDSFADGTPEEGLD